MKQYLQTIVETIQLENLPAEWLNFDIAKFSREKTLFDYQQKAIQNTLKALYKYYIDCKADKKNFFELYQNNGFTENLDYQINGNKKHKIFEEFDKDYKIINGRIAFHHFINRLSLWMATGSGKTLVIVKLLELLGSLIKKKQIPANDILFLTYREDLIDQFKKHIDEFNISNNQVYINLYNLKDYEKIKRENKLKYRNEIDIFYYRSDLISNEHKDKIVNFRNYDNFGKWYILLDEAHKGDKEESKKQWYYSILSRNGFMFNFSATFTDPIDFATCVYNFNLEKFISQGYGKHIYISQSNIENLGNKDEFTEKQKQIIILKILLLYTLIKKTKLAGYYHNPLILTLVNSVNTEDSDLFLFFKEIEKIANGKVSDEFLNEAKEKLNIDLQGKCEFDNEEIKVENSIIKNLSLNDILKNVFNADTNGKIEVLKIPGNNQEIILKIATSDKPFAVIKIGDISNWIKNKLSGYEIIERFENESVFKNLNQDDSDITLLLGSRAFYEGWDSNRPNIILYINIGKGIDARKFVLQSIGRGVRIEPIAHKKQRLQFLYNNNQIDKYTYNNLKDKIKYIETLFVYGTKVENLKEVIDTLKEEKQEELLGDLFEINPDTKDKMLLIPDYKESNTIQADVDYTIKFEINSNDINLLKNYFNYIGEKVALVKYDCEPKVLNKVKKSFSDTSNYYMIREDMSILNKPDLIMRHIFKHFSLRSKEFDNFKNLENEIIHFKQIRITDMKRKEIEEKIKQVLQFREKDKKLSEIAQKIQKQPQKAFEYTKEIENISKNYVKESEVQYNAERIKFKYLSNHYYLPLAMSDSEREIYFMHIIKTKSEVDFINQLERHLEDGNNFFKQFDWWFFSKIDETLDEVYIPYYQPKTNRMEKFKPDFIFWLKKGNDYTILFVDPKGTEFADSYRKIDGYKKIFEKYNDYKKFNNNYNLNIKVQLFFISNNKSELQEYQQYWSNDISDILEKI